MTPTRPASRRRLLPGETDIALPVILAAAASIVLFWGLGSESLEAWDEAIYAQVSKEVAQGGDWLTLHWEYKPWFEKPPLLMWATALLYRLFGVSEFWARAASALSGVGLVVVTYLTARSAYGRRVGLLSAVVLLTSYHFLSFSRFGTMEVLLTFFTHLALYAYLRLSGEGGERWWYLAWASCALAVMTKGAGGLLASAVVAAGLIFDGRLSDAAKSRHFRRGGLLALLLAAPWHAAMYALHGRAFVEEYVGYHVIARATGMIEGQTSTHLYYFGKLVDGFFPWCLLAPFAVAAAVRGAARGDRRPRLFLFAAALVFVAYTIIPTRRAWYIVPMYPALAALVAAFVVGLYESSRTRTWRRRAAAAVGALFVAVGGLYSGLSLYLNHRREEPVAQLARMARSTGADDREPLILFAESEHFHKQVPVFYSDRPVRQTYATSEPRVDDARRYVDFEKIDGVVPDAAGRVILRRDDVGRLAAGYDVRVLAEADPLIYAAIKRRQ